MADKSLANVKISQIMLTTAEWAEVTDPIPAKRLVFEVKTDGTVAAKIGAAAGNKTFTELPYISDGALSSYGFATETFVTNAIAELGTTIRMGSVVANFASLPTSDVAPGTIYFVGTAGEGNDSYEEYIYTAQNKWEYIGKVESDLSVFVTNNTFNEAIGKITDLNSYVPAINSYTNAEKAAVKKITDGEMIETGDTVSVTCVL